MPSASASFFPPQPGARGPSRSPAFLSSSRYFRIRSSYLPQEAFPDHPSFWNPFPPGTLSYDGPAHLLGTRSHNSLDSLCHLVTRCSSCFDCAISESSAVCAYRGAEGERSLRVGADRSLLTMPRTLHYPPGDPFGEEGSSGSLAERAWWRGVEAR